MTKDIKILLALALAPIIAIAMLALTHPLEATSFSGSHVLETLFGWSAIVALLCSMGYSYRKRAMPQGFGSLYAWRVWHCVTGYLFLVLLFMHANGWMGMESQVILSSTSIGIALFGLLGLTVQGLYPKWVTQTLVDSVYKDELKDDVNKLLREISKSIEGMSEDFDAVYQGHILNYLTIDQPTIKIYEDMKQRLLGQSTDHTHAAVNDLATLTNTEKDQFLHVTSKTLELMEIRLNQAYQRRMNGWLAWHIGLSALLGVILFSHVVASFYY